MNRLPVFLRLNVLLLYKKQEHIMMTQKIIFALGLSLSLSCLAAPPAADPVNGNQSTPPPSQATDNSKDNQQQAAEKKPSMAEYCKEHTC
jgi:hypothetical protein